MASDKDTELLITAKNVTEQAFKQVQGSLKDLRDQTKQASVSTSDLAASFRGLAGAVGVSFSVGALIGFGKSVFDSASKIHDLGEQIGISTDAVQGFKFAAEQSGSSLDTVGTAIQKMNKNLSEGDKGTVSALKAAGLSFEQIRSMKPEDAFLAIADGIQKIPDPMVQSQVALALFGKSAGELLPGIKEGFRGVAEGASKMSKDTIDSLEAAQDAWDQLGNKVTIVSGNIIAEVMKLPTTAKSGFTGITSSLASFGNFVADAFTHGTGAAFAMASSIEQVSHAAAAVPAAVAPAAAGIHQTKEELDAAEAAAKKWAETLDASFRKFSGADVAEQAKVLDVTFRRLADSGKLTQQQLHDVVEEAAKLAKQGATLSPRLWDVVMAMGALNPKLTEDAKAFADIGDKVDLVIPKLSAFAEASNELQKSVKAGAEGITDLGFKVSDGFAEGAKSIEEFNRAVKKAHDESVAQLVGMGQEIAQAFSGGGGFIQGLKNLGTSVAKDFTAGVLSFVPGIGPLLSQLAGPLVDGIKKLFGGLFGGGHDGRDLVKTFIAQNFGSASELQKQLLELGPEYDRLWRGVTQLGNNASTSEAQAAIDAVTKALETHKQKVQEDASASEQAAQQVTAAMSAARDNAKSIVDGLDQQLKSLQDSIANEAPEEVMGIVEANTRAQIEAITKQREDAQDALTEVNKQINDAADAAVTATQTAAEGAGKATADAIRAALDSEEFDVNVHLHADGNPTGGSIPPHADGAYIREDHIAKVHAGEIIGPADFMATALAGAFARMGGAPGGGDQFVAAPVQLDGVKLGELLLRRQGKILNRYRVNR